MAFGRHVFVLHEYQYDFVDIMSKIKLGVDNDNHVYQFS